MDDQISYNDCVHISQKKTYFGIRYELSSEEFKAT